MRKTTELYAAIKKDGTVLNCGFNSRVPQAIPAFRSKIAAVKFFRSRGFVVNKNGEISRPHSPKKIVATILGIFLAFGPEQKT